MQSNNTVINFTNINNANTESTDINNSKIEE